jgi:diacylglycerol kinase (ATP)
MNQTTSPFKSQRGLKRIIKAMQYSRQGLQQAWHHEAAFRQEVLLLLAAIIPAAWLSQTLLHFLLLIGSLLFVLIVELFNSALEALADAVTLEHHPLIGRAKDLGSAAVFLAFVIAAMVWLGVIFFRS